MRILALPVLAFLSLAGCDDQLVDANKNRVGPAVAADLTIDAGNVFEVRGPAGNKAIGGKFVIRPARPNELRVANATLGGACLVAQADGLNGRCTHDMQCDVRFGSGLTQKKWHGYCIGAGGDVPTKRCWVKPSDKYCLKMKPEGAYTIPAVDPSEVYRWAQAERGQREVRWMVHGCLNGPVAQGAGCAGGAGPFITDDGPPKPVRP